GQFFAERAGGVPGGEVADLVEFQQFERVSVHYEPFYGPASAARPGHRYRTMTAPFPLIRAHQVTAPGQERRTGNVPRTAGPRTAHAAIRAAVHRRGAKHRFQ